MNLPISALCIAAAASLFAYLTNQPMFLVFGLPLAIASGWVELQGYARREAEKPEFAKNFKLVDEDEAMAQRLAAFRKALHR